MSQSTRAFIICFSLVMILVMLLGCTSGKQGGTANQQTSIISKLQSLFPGAKKSSTATTADSGQTASANTGQNTSNTLPQDLLDRLHKTTSFSCALISIPTNITTEGEYQVGWRMNERPFYVPQRDKKQAFGKITWSGINFKYTPLPGFVDTLSGYVNYKNGVLLLSFDYVNIDPTDNLLMSVRNVPCDTKVFMDSRNAGNPILMSCQTGGPTVKPYITQLKWKSHLEQLKAGAKDGSMETWDAMLISVDWTKGASLCVTFAP